MLRLSDNNYTEDNLLKYPYGDPFCLNAGRNRLGRSRHSEDGIRQQRMLKIMAIADSRHFSYQNVNDLVDFIASEMQKEGLDPNNEENLDGYLNTKIM